MLSIFPIFIRHEMKTLNCPRGRWWTHFPNGKLSHWDVFTTGCKKWSAAESREDAGGTGCRRICVAAQNVTVADRSYAGPSAPCAPFRSMTGTADGSLKPHLKLTAPLLAIVKPASSTWGVIFYSGLLRLRKVSEVETT